MSGLIDSHAHLDEIESLETTIAEARSANIVAIVGVGSGYRSNQRILEIAQRYQDFVYPALGLHPWNLKDTELDCELAFIEAHIEKAVAIGEIGLDYHKKVRAIAEKERQKYVFKEILKIAKRYHKPVIIHSRYAWRDAFTLVEEAQVAKAVFHWYTGTSSVLRDIVGQGYFVSATPAVAYHKEHRRAVREAPLDRLLLETDSPVVYQRGSEFEYKSRPADIIRSLQGVVGLKGKGQAQIAAITTKNARQFFQLED